jgi:SAM-dependent methyltransferase
MIVDSDHFAFLRLQRGAIADLAGDFPAWLVAYERSLRDDFASLEPFLPKACRSVLDVGSGLGGIDVLLNRHYGGGVQVNLLDGWDDEPAVTAHDRTFNDMLVAGDFLRRNGVEKVVRVAEGWQRRVELVVSLQAFGFHFPPALYLPLVRGCVHPGTVLIFDVRVGRDDWLGELRGAFTEVSCALARPKFNRMVFYAK